MRNTLAIILLAIFSLSIEYGICGSDEKEKVNSRNEIFEARYNNIKDLVNRMLTVLKYKQKFLLEILFQVNRMLKVIMSEKKLLRLR